MNVTLNNSIGVASRLYQITVSNIGIYMYYHFIPSPPHLCLEDLGGVGSFNLLTFFSGVLGPVMMSLHSDIIEIIGPRAMCVLICANINIASSSPWRLAKERVET